MIKRAVYLVLFLCFAFAFGAPVSFETAQSIANNYLQQNGKSAVKLTQVKKKRDVAPFFVFSKGAGKGFVVVAANDVASPIFCETDEGDYDENNLPPAFFWMMDNYESYISDAEKNKRSQDGETKAQWEKYSKPSNQTRGEVRAKTFLLTTKWNQFEPFNLYAPRNSRTYAGESCSNITIRAYAGCVAVSMAQIMKYHKYPAQLTQDIPSYKPANGLLASTTIPGRTIAQAGTFNYNDMLDTYDVKGYSISCVEGYPSGGNTQEKAVANLMYCAAIAFQAKWFNQNGTGAYIGDEANALKNYFGYDVTNITITNNSAAMRDTIANNIARSQPIIGQGGGHTYNIDGYDPTDQQIHVNYGYGGSGDGWFAMNNVRYGSNNNSPGNMSVNIKPRGGSNPTPTNYTITFNSNGGSAVAAATVVAGAAFTPSTNPTRTGCTFDGWYTAGDLITKWVNGTAVNSNMTLYAKWNATITYNANGGSVPKATEVVEADVTYNLAEYNAATRSGFTFDGWHTDANTTTKASSVKVTANMTLYAKWNSQSNIPATYIVTLNARNGSSPSAASVSSSAGYSPANPTRTGCTFDGWHTDSTNWTGKWTNGTVPAGNMTLFAKWNAKVNFNTNGGNTIAQATTTTERSYTPPTTPTRTGYNFAGWFTDAAFNNAWSTSTGLIVRDTTLFARWTEEIKNWTISFDLDGGSGVQGIRTVTSNNPYYNAIDDIPTKAGFNFVGWFADAAKTIRWTSATQVIGNTTLYAKWESGVAEEKTYNVRIMWYEDKGDDDHSWWVDYETVQVTVTAANPYWYPKIDRMRFDSVSHVTGFGHDGDNTSPKYWDSWKDGESKLVRDTTILLWEFKPLFYVITFGDEYREVSTVSYPNWANFVPDAPTKEGYDFKGWFTDTTWVKEWTAASQIVRDTTIYAKWKARENDSGIVIVTPPDSGTAIKGGKGFDGKHGIAAVKNPVGGDFAEFVIKTPESWTLAKLTIYDNLGNVVFSDERRLTIRDDRMKWNLRNGNVRTVAAGSYLAVVECKGASGTYQYYTKFGVRK